MSSSKDDSYKHYDLWNSYVEQVSRIVPYFVEDLSNNIIVQSTDYGNWDETYNFMDYIKLKSVRDYTTHLNSRERDM